MKPDVAVYKKMTADAVQGLLAMRKRGGVHKAHKGKGSYDRKSFKKGEK